jgi:hypothetical protein
MVIRLRAIVVGLFLAFCLGGSTHAASFVLGNNANGLTGHIGPAVLTRDGVTLTITHTLSGAKFDESGKGLGVDARGTPSAALENTSLGGTDKLNLQQALGPLTAFTAPAVFYGESLRFGFDRAGTITALMFDGVKDESFEFFQLESSRQGVLHSFFDAEIGLRITDPTLLTVPNKLLLTDAIVSSNDDRAGLAIPVAPGEVFTLTYGEFIVTPNMLKPGNGLLEGNGARWEGVVFTAAPEPSSLAMLGLIAIVTSFSRVRSQGRRA